MQKYRLSKTFTLHIKKNEFNSKKPDDMKPRNIFNPHPSIKAIAGWVNFNLLRLSKEINPYFVHGLNTEEVASKLDIESHKLFSDYTFVTWDGSNFDSH
jgi:hypothetical protein